MLPGSYGRCALDANSLRLNRELAIQNDANRLALARLAPRFKFVDAFEQSGGSEHTFCHGYIDWIHCPQLSYDHINDWLASHCSQ